MNTSIEGHAYTIAAALYDAYTQSLNDECRMRYVTAKYQVLKGNQIYNARDSAIIASIHAVKL